MFKKRINTSKILGVISGLTAISLALTISVTPASAQQIITDGNTNTTISTSGNVSTVSTSTVSGQNAFNSFSKFNVDAGNTVNLALPGSVENLINIVTSQRSDINGILNSIKNGVSGAGNVFLVNPYGVTVGAMGSINVGSLTAITLTTDFVNTFFTSPGNPNAASVTAVLNGTAPINPNGSIINEGVITVLDNVNLTAGTINNLGTIVTDDVGMGDIVNIKANSVNLGPNSKIQSIGGEVKIVSNAVSIDTSNPGYAVDADYVTINRNTVGDIKIVSKKNSKDQALQLTPAELDKTFSYVLEIGNGIGVDPVANNITVDADVTRIGDLVLEGKQNIAFNANVSTTGGSIIALAGDKLSVKDSKTLTGSSDVILLATNNVNLGNKAAINSTYGGVVASSDKGDVVLGSNVNLTAKGDVMLTAYKNLTTGSNTKITSSANDINLISETKNIVIGNNSQVTAYDDVNMDAANQITICPCVTVKAGDDITLAAKKICIYKNAKLIAGGDINKIYK